VNPVAVMALILTSFLHRC